jgi:hypothetical protein
LQRYHFVSNNFSEAIQTKTKEIQDFIFYPEKKRLVIQKVMKSPTNLTAFYVLLSVHLSIILVNDQLDAQFFFLYVYFNSLHVSSNLVRIIRRINCINTSGMCHSAWVTHRRCCIDTIDSADDEQDVARNM